MVCVVWVVRRVVLVQSSSWGYCYMMILLLMRIIRRWGIAVVWSRRWLLRGLELKLRRLDSAVVLLHEIFVLISLSYRRPLEWWNRSLLCWFCCLCDDSLALHWNQFIDSFWTDSRRWWCSCCCCWDCWGSLFLGYLWLLLYLFWLQLLLMTIIVCYRRSCRGRNNNCW